MLLNWNFDKLKKITNGSNSNDIRNFKVTGFSIDSRSLKKGDIFCALKGMRYDGHDFLLQAYKKGASCFLLSDINKKVPNLPYIKVDNVLNALEKIASNVRKQNNARFIAITGSVGKTGTKEMLKQALGNIGKTFANEGNFNNYIGVPLSLSRVPNNANYCILELGMNKAGEIKKLSNLVSPEIGIITAIENSHLQGLKTLKKIAEAKSEILESIQKDGCFIYNDDTNFSSYLREKAEAAKIKTIISYGKNQKANIQLLKKTKTDDKHIIISAKFFDRKISWKMPNIGDHWYLNSLCILGVGKYYEINLNTLLTGLENFKLPKGRGNFLEIVKGSKKFYLVDDSYNSNPASLSAALNQFKSIRFPGRKIAILGDMKELGENSVSLHINMKEIIEKSNLDLVFTIGKFMKSLNRELSPIIEKYHFEDTLKLEIALREEIKKGDCILVKGSHSLQLNTLVKNIVGDNYDI